MSKTKYWNGMYKSTSHSQEETAQRWFHELGKHQEVVMGYNLHQATGFLTVEISWRKTEKPIVEFTLNRVGKIVDPQ